MKVFLNFSLFTINFSLNHLGRFTFHFQLLVFHLVGLVLQNDLRKAGSNVPMIFITGFDSTEILDRAGKEGVVYCYRKPVDNKALLDAINWALVNQSKTNSTYIEKERK